MTASNDYPIVVSKLRPEDGAGFIAFAPDLNGCMSDGETQEEAVSNCGQAIKEWIDVAQRHGRAVPQPGSAARKQADARANLAKELTEQKAAFERLNSQIEEVRRDIDAVSQRIEESSTPDWTPDLVLVAAKYGRSEDVIH
jgi:antitoxin HicB